jgi:hypothetical protein
MEILIGMVQGWKLLVIGEISLGRFVEVENFAIQHLD